MNTGPIMAFNDNEILDKYDKKLIQSYNLQCSIRQDEDSDSNHNILLDDEYNSDRNDKNRYQNES